LGVTVLLATHLLAGHQLSPGEIAATVTMVIFVAVRQVLVTGAQRVLTRRLYEAQHTLAHQVLHDPLTGLPNRLFFAQRLDEAMRERRFVLIFVDLDDFKEVNDRFGHAAGDDLLCAVGERLARCVGNGDMLARIGGDEFAILIGGESESPDVVAERLRLALREPFPVHGSSVRVRASMGLVRPGLDGAPQTSDDLLRQADVSMYAGKRLGKNTAIVYQPSAGVHADFPTALRAASGGVPTGFSLAYQPIVSVPDQVVVAVEALARWTAPNGIHIPPQTFVAVAESAGLGAMLDALVLDLACREVQAAGLGADIHVNIGAARLGNVDFERRLRQTLDRYRVAPERLVVEITETVPIVDLPDAAAQIARLRAAGVRVALDDFGAGYNSLTYLHGLPVNVVKLDRSLAPVADRARDLALYRSVIGLCADLGIDVIAEGIETTGQLATIAAAGCRLAQGRLFGWPAPITQFDAQWQGGLTGSGADSPAIWHEGD
ncbi:MAG: EAL domain-containing protein, partial [Mycobacterium sp.]|nr:EAL domain-containing protein [Mycobacterium sp.]